ncbi:hypothetical protein F5887DRAFT_950957 [Amanita rubescens]|nr:hypothetical protein F5887DRAFT_950957 [Amanita rubescens]
MQQDFVTVEHSQLLRKSFSSTFPFCRGVLPVAPNDLLLYYGSGNDESARRLNLFYPPSQSLELLVKACDPATFGRNKEDVYDESYRKAKKLNTGSFMVGLDVVRLGLPRIISEALVVGQTSPKSVRAELYKLNIYGEGSFFKAHVDTPRGTKMFGSLVILFPTSFEGGELIMRKGENEWSFDAAQALAGCQGHHIAYVALYSDVEHEVSMVKSGHRISITYNLYLDDDTQALTIPMSLSHGALGLKNTLETLLLDATFFPEGGWLGFNLEHKYPVACGEEGNYINLNKIGACLKGIDAEIVRVAKELSLRVSLRAFVAACDTLIAFEGSIPYLNHVLERDILCVSGAIDLEEDMRVHWITEPSGLNQHYPPDVNGNEPAVEYEYESFCLFIEVGKPGMRTTPPTLAPQSEFMESDED